MHRCNNYLLYTSKNTLTDVEGKTSTEHIFKQAAAHDVDSRDWSNKRDGKTQHTALWNVYWCVYIKRENGISKHILIART